MHAPKFQDAIDARRNRERYLAVNTHLNLRVTKVASVNLAIKGMEYKSNPSEVVRVLLDEGARSFGFDLEKII